MGARTQPTIHPPDPAASPTDRLRFSWETLAPIAAAHAQTYAAGDPFPHIAIDGLVPDPILRRAVAAFPEPGDLDWQRFQNPRERKLASHIGHIVQMPDPILDILNEFNHVVFVRFLEILTGIEGLMPDHTFVGGGLHQIETGGLLKVHADFNRHPGFGLDRRLNVLLYLNEDWPEDYGGHLELWDPTMTRCAQRIPPLFNRCVIFSTTSTSYHGHPEPLTCPPNRYRRSLAWYFYSNGRPPGEVAQDHSTLFQKRPGES